MNRPVIAKLLVFLPFLLLLGSATCLAQTGTPAPLPAVATPANTLDSGDTAWMLTSSAFVMLMVPGLALFYGGMVRRKNVLGTIMHSLAALGIIGVEWIVVGYALSFGNSWHGLIGWNSDFFMLRGVLPTAIHPGTHIPELVFCMFQGMFAIITPALITGAFAERVKFSGFALFTLLWGLLIYNPLAHWVWGGGWLGAGESGFHIGAIDFAGGTVVHISAGFSALVAALYVGKRLGYPAHVLQPNSIVMTLLGGGLLWFGWFGFNAGSAGAANGSAALAFTTTQVAAAAGGMAWLIAEWIKHGRPTSLGFVSGFVAGLVAVTPASGYVAPWGALIIGLAAGAACYGAVLVKARLGYDDSLDAFGVHGVGGFLGAVLTGVFALQAFGGTTGLFDGAAIQVWRQLVASIAAAAYASIGTIILCILVDKLVGFRASRSVEIEGLDVGIHGEQGWMLEQVPVPASSFPSDQPV